MNIPHIATKIVDDHIKSNIDLNDSIAKIASASNMSLNHTKRLIEEVNKHCYLTKFATTGEQIFDVAQLEKVQECVKQMDVVEKKASIKFERFEPSLDKVASENAATSLDYQKAINVCSNEIGTTLTKIAKLRECIVFEMPSLEKYASSMEIADGTQGTHIEKIGTELAAALENLGRKTAIRQHLMEKRASLTGALVQGGVTAAGKGAVFVAKSPFNRGLVPMDLAHRGMAEAKKIEGGSVVSNIPHVDDLMKNAGFGTDLVKGFGTDLFKGIGQRLGKGVGQRLTSLEGLLPNVVVLGGLGLAVGAARGMGGLASKMMEKKELDRAFHTIEQANADIRGMPNARAYFDVVARHSPDIAKDPLTTAGVIRSFNSFDGVDLKSVAELRDMQSNGGRSDSSAGEGGILGQAKSLLDTLS